MLFKRYSILQGSQTDSLAKRFAEKFKRYSILQGSQTNEVIFSEYISLRGIQFTRLSNNIILGKKHILFERYSILQGSQTNSEVNYAGQEFERY